MIYLFLANGFEEIEAITTIDLLRRAKLLVTTVSISTKKQVQGAHQITIEADALFDGTDFGNATCLILPGGMPGTTNLAAHQGLAKLLVEFNRQNKPIAAICAAPIVLAELGILTGKQATCYPGFEAKLGESYIGGILVESKNIITAKGAGIASDFALSIISKLATEEIAHGVASAAIF